ncbi:MAG TPA: S1 RNA-binding domain-containing protein, partial [Chthonomonadaceae bacterium]|nr:S1 RNA-binding domain-containing protein [Chthonomonadaceae bacterium]
FIAAVDQDAGRRAADAILNMVAEVEVGQIYTGRVTRLIGMGAFVEILPGKEGLVHVSHLRVPPVRRPEEAVKVGDALPVRVIEIDPQGRVNLSAINLDQPFDPSMARRAEDGRGGGGGRFGDRDRGGRPGMGGGDRDRDRDRRGPRPGGSPPPPQPEEEEEGQLPRARFRPRR